MGQDNVIKAGTAATVDSGKGGSVYDTNKPSDVLARVFMAIYSESDKDRLVNMFPSIDKSKLAFGDIAAYDFINNQTVKGIPIIAKSIDPNITKYPIKNELIQLKLSSTYHASNPSGNYIPDYYYTSIIGVWSITEHNAVPEAGKNFSDGNIFTETGKIRKLIPGPGDMSFEGRSGHSIRFGSSVKDFTGTPWVGPDRSPFMIIRNGQKDATGLEQIYEDINKDGSSLYMMNGHSIGFLPASLNFDSYGYNVVAQVNSNVVETKPVVQTLPSQSAAAVDTIPVKDTIPETLPVVQQTSSSIDDLAQQDEDELPETEGLDFYQETIEFERISAGRFLIDSSFGIKNPSQLITQNQTITVPGGITNTPARMTKYKDSTLYNDSQFRSGLKKICDKYKISDEDFLRIMYTESSLNPQKGLYKNPIDGASPRYLNTPKPGWKLKAIGLIQWTSKAVGAPSCGKSLDEISKLTAMQQLTIIDCYLASSKNKLIRRDGNPAERAILYAIIFYPDMVQSGVFIRPDNWVLGSESKDPNYKYEVARSNPAVCRGAGIPEGTPITVGGFKKYVNSI
jgi:hypothetical protein